MGATEIISAVTTFGAMPALGAGSAIAVDKVASRFGHSFSQYGLKNQILIALIGAIQNFVSFLIFANIEKTISDSLPKDLPARQFVSNILSIAVAQVITIVPLIALTAVAVKVNLLSAHLGLFAGLAMIVVNAITTTATIAALDQLDLKSSEN